AVKTRSPAKSPTPSSAWIVTPGAPESVKVMLRGQSVGSGGSPASREAEVASADSTVGTVMNPGRLLRATSGKCSAAAFGNVTSVADSTGGTVMNPGRLL